MRIALIILGVVAVTIAVIVTIGYMLPVKHRASRMATLPATPDNVYSIIADVRQYPTWRPSVKDVELVSTSAPHPQFRETSGDGVILYAVEAEESPSHRVTRIADKSLPFGGTWTYDIRPIQGGTTLRITEDGEVYNPIFRFMSRFVLSQHATIDRYLADLSAKLGGPPHITE